MSNHCLGVARSFLGQAWHERLDGLSHGHALAMVQRHGLPDLLARVLAGRGVTADSCQSFLAPSLRTLMPDPATLVDMEAATERLAQAVERGVPLEAFHRLLVLGAGGDTARHRLAHPAQQAGEMVDEVGDGPAGAGRHGRLGAGLGAIRRLMDEFEVYSTLPVSSRLAPRRTSHGTALLARKWLGRAGAEADAATAREEARRFGAWSSTCPSSAATTPARSSRPCRNRRPG